MKTGMSLRVALLTASALSIATPAAAQTAAEIIDATADPAVEAQLLGEYGELERDPSLPLGAIQRAWDDAPADAGVYRVAWSPDEVIRLRVREAMPTQIVLPEWETIADVTLGDDRLFSYVLGSMPNMITIHAGYVGADAGLTIVGGVSGNVYAFMLRAEGFNSENIPDLVAYITAPPPPMGAPSGAAAGALGMSAMPDAGGGLDQVTALVHEAAAPVVGAEGQGAETGLHDPDYLEAIPFDPADLNFAFTMSGDKDIAPERVFSDGLFTYFDYGDRWTATDLPAVYRVIDGVDTPQNVRYRGTMIIVESTGAFTMRNGQRVVCIRPVGWNPADPEPASESGELPRIDVAFHGG